MPKHLSLLAFKENNKNIHTQREREREHKHPHIKHLISGLDQV